MSITRDDWEREQFQLASAIAIATAKDSEYTDAQRVAQVIYISNAITTESYGEKPEEPEAEDATPPHIYTRLDFGIGETYVIETAGRDYKGVVDSFISDSLALIELSPAKDPTTKTLIKLSDITDHVQVERE